MVGKSLKAPQPKGREIRNARQRASSTIRATTSVDDSHDQLSKVRGGTSQMVFGLHDQSFEKTRQNGESRVEEEMLPQVVTRICLLRFHFLVMDTAPSPTLPLIGACFELACIASDGKAGSRLSRHGHTMASQAEMLCLVVIRGGQCFDHTNLHFLQPCNHNGRHKSPDDHASGCSRSLC